MWLQFTRMTHCQISFISYPKISSKVWLMLVIKNKEIFLVQIATRPFPKHIYRSLIVLFNSSLTRNEFGSFQTQPIQKIEGSKPSIYTFYTKTRQIPYSNPYNTLDFHTCDLLFPFLLYSFLFSSSSSSSSSFLFSSLLSVFALSFSKTKMRYLFWSYPYLILSHFYFNFFFLLLFFFYILEHP